MSTLSTSIQYCMGEEGVPEISASIIRQEREIKASILERKMLKYLFFEWHGFIYKKSQEPTKNNMKIIIKLSQIATQMINL